MQKELASLRKKFSTAAQLIDVLESNSFAVRDLFSADEDPSRMEPEIVLSRMLGESMHDPSLTPELIFLKQRERSLTRSMLDAAYMNEAADLARHAKSETYQKGAIDSTVKSFFNYLNYMGHECM